MRPRDALVSMRSICAGGIWYREFPYRKALGTVIDCGRFAANMDDAVITADHAGFAMRQEMREAARHAAWHRHHLFHGDRTRRTERRCGNPLRRRWPGDIVGRHAVQRHGSRDRVCADRRRSAGSADRCLPLRAGGYRARCAQATAMAGRVPCTWAALRCARRWTRCWQRGARSPRDCCRRRSNRSYLPRVALPCAARRIAPSICWRSHVPHATRKSAGRHGARPGHLCLEPARRHHLPQRLPHRRSGDRSGHRRRHA